MIWSQILIDALHLWILAMACGFLLHELGMITLGHTGILLAGAYGYGFIMLGRWSPAEGLLLAVITTTFLSLAALRVQGDIFTILSFAFAESLRHLAIGLVSITGGTNGLGPIHRPPWSAHEGGALSAALGASGLAVVVYFICASGKWGIMTGAIRDDELLARAYGVRSRVARFMAVAITGLAAASVGLLQVAYFGLAVPSLGDIGISLQSVAAAMLALPLWKHGRPLRVVAGLGCGAFVLTILPPLLRQLWFGGSDVALLRQFVLGSALYALVHPRSPFSKRTLRIL